MNHPYAPATVWDIYHTAQVTGDVELDRKKHLDLTAFGSSRGAFCHFPVATEDFKSFQDLSWPLKGFRVLFCLFNTGDL